MDTIDYRSKLTCDRPQPRTHDQPRDLITETESNRGRIIQSAALRRLQQKTQVYPLETNASVRSRLTHSLEVQQTARYLSKTILDQLKHSGKLVNYGLAGIETAFTNLVEMSCLLHDVGNPPFGHFGEVAFSRWVQEHGQDCHRKAIARQTMIQQGKPDSHDQNGHSDLFTHVLFPDLCVFEGNAQGLRIIHSLQSLNLTWSQLAATIKYTRAPYQDAQTGFHYRQKKPGFYYSEQGLIEDICQYLKIEKHCRFPLVYIMEAADDISYCIADLEDAMDKGILTLRGLSYWLNEVWQEHSATSDYLPKLIKSAETFASDNPQDFIRHLRSHLVRDLVSYAANRYLDQHDAVFNGTLDEPLIDGGSDQHLALKTLKAVAIRHVFSSQEKETPELRGHAALRGLLDIYRPILELPRDDFAKLGQLDNSEHFIEYRLNHRLSRKYKAAYLRAIQQVEQENHSPAEANDLEWYFRTRLILDYISGMTDHFVLTEYQTLSAI
ncbi:dGTPase [uncultured Endozoicomonas sp.]|uniref:dGTPase n=1 Tax=uncultured Endozoicomonas sp. TaxID=432652 RepID=UPI002602D52C|nr:dGTPase [uncultured Endozoicomonas sp.]